MVNVNKLKGRIVESGLSISELAERIGVDKTTLYRKIDNNGETFLIKEVDAIITALNLSGSDVNAIFFSQVVA